MIRLQNYAVCAWIALALLACSLSQAETRIGVIASEGAESEKSPPLVELRLARQPGVVLLERDAIEEVLREQQLQAVLAVDAPGKRAALGKMLKADLLVFLATCDKPKPHMAVVVCETRQGLRICSEKVPLLDKPETEADAVFQQVAAAMSKQRENIVDIVAVPPLVNNSLTHEADNLQTALARLVERSLLRRPGVLVVELAEAKALAREMVVSSAPGIERRLPLYLMGEYRFDGAGEKRRAQFAWRLLRGEKELDRRNEKDLEVAKMPDRLQQASLNMVAKALGKNQAACDPESEAKQLASRARMFVDLGIWEEALAMAEASLLLEPDQPAVHGDALRAMLEINEARPCMQQSLQSGLSAQEALEAIQWLRAALPHLEAFFRGTEVDQGHYWYVSRKWGMFHLRQLTPDLREACFTLRHEMREAAVRVLAAKAKGKRPDNSLAFLWRWTDPPIEPPENETLNFVLCLMEPHLVPLPKAAREAWLTKHLPEVCEYRLKLLQDFIWLTEDRMNYGECQGLTAIHEPDKGLLSTDPVYLEFLAKVENLPNPHMQRCARDKQEELRTQAQRLKEREERIRIAAQTPPQVTPPPPAVENPEVVFHAIALRTTLPNGGEKVFHQFDERRRQVKESTPWWMVEAWIPLYDGCDMVYFGSRPAIVWEETGAKVVPVAVELALMKEKGRLRPLPLKLIRSSPKTREGAMIAGMKDELLNACWDGKYLWALNPGEKGPLSVVEPREEKIWKIGPEDGLPPSISCGIAPLGPGKVCIAGFFGRLWVALAAFDGDRIKFEVIHEARTVPPGEYRFDDNSAERHSPKLAHPITFVSTIASPSADGGAVKQRVVIGRLLTAPLIVDPEARSVTSPLFSTPTQNFSLRHADAIYWTDMEKLYRMGFPDFAKEVTNPAPRHGTCAFYEGRFYFINSFCTGFDVAPSLKEPWRRLKCEVPGSCWYPSLFTSRHYGLLLSTEQGVYSVELKKP